MDTKFININEGASALCVLSPPLNCNGRKYDDNYVSKLVNISDSSVKITIYRELIISKILKELSNKNVDKYFSIVEDSCYIDVKSIPTKFHKICKINNSSNNKYLLLYSKNGGCKELKQKNIVFYENDENNISPHILLEQDLKKKKYLIRNLETKNELIVDKIYRYCGNISNKFIIKKLFYSKSSRKKYIKQFIRSIELLINNKIVHFDIKLNNMVCNEESQIKIIDFGASICFGENYYYNAELMTKILSLNSEEIKEQLKNNSKFKNLLFEYIGIHTEFYTPPEILFLKLTLKNYTKEGILNYIFNCYNIKPDFNLYNKFSKVIDYYNDNIITLIKDLFNNKSRNLIYKFDIFSLGIMLKEIIKILYKYNNIKVENSLINLVEKMTDINVYKRLSIKQIINHTYLK
jgi:serine/threonine protein kinase